MSFKSFDRSARDMTLFDAACWHNLQGRDGFVGEVTEFDIQTIDPMFRLFEDGKLIATGVPWGGGEAVAIPAGWWRSVTCGAPIANQNQVTFDAVGGGILGDTLTAAGAARPHWTNILVGLEGLLSQFPAEPEDHAVNYASAPHSSTPSMPALAPRKRKNRAPSKQERAIEAYLAHRAITNQAPRVSTGELADGLADWLAVPENYARFGIKGADERTFRNYFDRKNKTLS